MQLAALTALVTLLLATAAQAVPVGLDPRDSTKVECRKEGNKTICVKTITKTVTKVKKVKKVKPAGPKKKQGGAKVIEVPNNPPPPPPSPPKNDASVISNEGGQLTEQEQAFLDLHNNFRAPRGASAMKWNPELAAAAKKHASGCVFEHSGGKLGPFGENLADRSPSMSPEQAVKAWADDEEADYDPNNPQPSHFTQVVWKGSTELGCAIVRCPPGSLFDPKFGEADYAVCEYFPQGNVIGQFPENVTKKQ